MVGVSLQPQPVSGLHVQGNTRGARVIVCGTVTMDAADAIIILLDIQPERVRRLEIEAGVYCVPARGRICLLVGCLTSQQQASVSQGRICTDNFTCCHTEIEAADQTFHLTQSQYTDTGPTSPSADPITPGAWQGSHWSANV